MNDFHDDDDENDGAGDDESNLHDAFRVAVAFVPRVLV
jgi:hypothetical protein